MKVEQCLLQLMKGKDLKEKEAYLFFYSLFKGEIPSRQAKAFVLLLAKKGETAPEIIGCLKALQELEPPKPLKIKGLMDTCGTGGDGSGSINVSTLAAITIAAAGGKVAKHGNRAITSQTGSSDLMEAFGVNLEAKPELMFASIRRNGLGYFHAPVYHPVFGRVQSLRRQLKTRTIFNYLGPLANPVVIETQVIGVSRKEFLFLYAEVLKAKGLRRALICHGRDGMDEISASAVTDAVFLDEGRLRRLTIDPASFGISQGRESDYRGGNVRKNHSLARRILAGKLSGPMQDLVALNAAAGLWITGIAPNLREGFEMARSILASGEALNTIEGLAGTSRGK